ncbi:MAG TPA: hypothetical protein VFQ68_37065 [Streptosporangiaceae bacterium]|nr:hypothetical protein [Streptosporangiaceae bacterium]
MNLSGPSTPTRITHYHHGQPPPACRQPRQHTSQQAFWEQISVGPEPAGSVPGRSHPVDVPAALRIDFVAGPAWMVAGIPQAPGMQEVFVPGDEIMVVLSAERMRQTGFPDSEFVTASRG